MIENTIMSILFDEDEMFGAGDLYDNKVIPVFPVATGFQYFTVNPHGTSQSCPTMSQDITRCDENVSKFRNFVFEMDDITLKEQEILIDSIDIDFSTVIFSGGKSYHCIISLESALNLPPKEIDSINEYKRVWKRLAAYIDMYAQEIGLAGPGVTVLDPSCCNPSRYTRYPNSLRLDKGVIQEVKYSSGRMSEYKFNKLLSKCPKIEKSKVFSRKLNDDMATTKLEFLKRCSSGLVNTIKYAPKAGASGMYSYAYKTTLWAIDEGMPCPKLFTSIMEEYFMKRLLKANYYDKEFKNIYKAIEDAYNEKLGA